MASALHRTGSEKFAALVGEGSRIGVVPWSLPGAHCFGLPGPVVPRTALCDQEAVSEDSGG
jgi:hypothetical protein